MGLWDKIAGMPNFMRMERGHFRHRTFFCKARGPEAPKHELLVTSGSVYGWTPV